MQTTRTNTTPTTLFWSERGHITCAKQAPVRGSDTRRWERRQPVPAEVLELPGGANLRRESCGKRRAVDSVIGYCRVSDGVPGSVPTTRI